MAHAFGNGLGAVYYDEYSSNNNVSEIYLTIQDSAESNQLVYVRGALACSLDNSQYISINFLTNQNSIINSKYSCRVSGTTSRYNTTSGNNIILNGWWFIGGNSSPTINSDLFDFEMLIDMTRNAYGAVRGQWTVGYEDGSSYYQQCRGAFQLISSTAITKLKFFANGQGTGYVRGKLSSQVLLGNY
tara:strand:- start:190 stop:750 length:561 start_codon:yes stop_codon:yes gene_type:complete